MMALLSALAMEIAIPVCAVMGIVFYLVSGWLKSRDSDKRNNKKRGWTPMRPAEDEHKKITEDVLQGVKYYLSTGYRIVGVFVVAFVILILLILGSLESFSTQSRPCKSHPSNKCEPALTTAFFTAASFLLGAFISVLSGFFGMEIALRANGRTALKKISVDAISISALRSGAVIGFFPAGIGLLGLYLVIILFELYYGNDWEGLFEAITGYGLGGSSMALFLRASGGIYAKAADVCHHLVEDIEPWSSQTDLNPAVITNYVGDIVGDIAGVGPDCFGSYAASSCAALVVASVSSFGINQDFTAMCYPLLISFMGIFVCTVTILMEKIPILGIIISIIRKIISILMKKILFLMEKIPSLRRKIPILMDKIKLASKKEQLIISTILMTAGIVVVSLIALPPLFTVYKIESLQFVKNWELFLCVAVGLWAGLIIEFVKVHDASNGNDTCSGTSNVNVGLGSVSVPLFAAVSISVSSHFAATYGIAVAALGMLSTISTRLAKDAYDRISDNTERIAKMAGVRSGNADDKPTADITGGFAIESAALVSIALFGAFASRPAVSSPAGVLTLKVMIGLGMGAYLPSYFSAMTMKRVGRAGFEMAWQIGVNRSPGCNACFQIATNASFNWIKTFDALVMFAPLIVGTLFGVEMLSGLLVGALGSLVQIAILASKAGGAWNQAKEDIRAGALEYAMTLNLVTPKEKRLLQFAKEGKTTGNPRKDTSGPPLNILVQLMAVESLVLAPWFASHDGLLSKIIEGKLGWGQRTYLL